MVRKALKFGHTLGAIGLLGAMACLMVALTLLDPTAEPEAGALILLMDRIARWLLLPSLGVTLVSGLLSMAAVPGYQSVGWAWAKLATGVLMFEGSLMAIQGPIQGLAEDVINTAGTINPETLAAVQGSLWVLGGVAVVNVFLGVWRPRFGRARVASSVE